MRESILIPIEMAVVTRPSCGHGLEHAGEQLMNRRHATPAGIEIIEVNDEACGWAQRSDRLSQRGFARTSGAIDHNQPRVTQPRGSGFGMGDHTACVVLHTAHG